MVGRRSRRDPQKTGLDNGKVVGRGDPPERGLHRERQLGQGVHQAQIGYARQRGEDGVVLGSRHVLQYRLDIVGVTIYYSW